MPLDAKELDKLCVGRVVIAKLNDSLDSAFAKDRPAIVISTAEQAKRGLIRVAGVTHNDQIDKEFLMPMPGYAEYDGHICGSFTPWVEEADIKRIRDDLPVLSVPELNKLLALVRQADAAKKASPKTQKKSTQ